MKRAKHSLSHYKLLSCNMGELVPIALMEVLPGDSIQHMTSALVRASPMLAPLMHPVNCRIHHWFVPHRIIWEDWEDFITGGPDNEDTSVFPTISSGEGGFAVGSLADYLGVPPSVPNLSVSALPFRAYALIYNEWYRDQDLVNPLVIDETSGPDTTTNTAMQNVAWEKDYFTTCRPWPQKGPDITLPLGSVAPIKGLGIVDTQSNSASSAVLATSAADDWNSSASVSSGFRVQLQSAAAASPTNRPQIFADLSQATAASINQLREAFALQKYAEARSMFGSRYTEYLRYLGVRSSDARLQRPEYLGGGKNTLQISEVLQTGPQLDDEDAYTGVGNLKGHGIGALRSNRYRRFFEEHGYIISILSVKPKTMYVQGLSRTWNRRIKEDFFQKEFQHIGQQEVQYKELYAAHSTPDGTFGYQDRYDEYRRMESGVAGQFRTTELDFWHMARIFGTPPELNGDFITSVPTRRIFADQDPDSDILWIMAQHSVQARRLVHKTGTPGGF